MMLFYGRIMVFIIPFPYNVRGSNEVNDAKLTKKHIILEYIANNYSSS